MRPHADALVRGLRPLWTNKRVFFAALTLFNLYAARNTFRSGIWADNDSVCHYAYLRHLLEEFYPATGTFFGWTPKYNLGTPFLVYNTPPGLYVAAAIVSKLTGLSALWGLKTVVLFAYLAVPLLGAAFAATFEPEPRDLSRFVGLSLSLFSSELFGLEFFFKNGMLNPAVALPLALATLYFFRRAQLAAGPVALRWVAAAAVALAATAFVHLLTLYMLVVAMGCFAFARGWRYVGRSVFQAGAIVALGCGLVAFWLVPSLPFAAKEDAAYTWIRPWRDTLSAFFDGSSLSSYFVGFYPHFFTFSAVGVVAIICSAFGVWRLTVRFNTAAAVCLATALLALMVAIGPRPSFGLWILPMYDRLLWHRFMSLATVMILVFAGWSAWRIWELRRTLGVTVILALIGGGVWAGTVVFQRAYKVTTVVEGPAFLADLDEVATWLRDHGKGGGRVYSEFLAQNVVESVSVNYPRHMLPILSGVPEASGWVYENNEAAQRMLKEGLLWYNPFPMIALAERYDVQFMVAGSPNLVRALLADPRWKLALETPHLVVFEAAGREPSLVEGHGVQARVESEGFLRGGGYTYAIAIRVEPESAGTAGGARELILKTSWSPAWKATLGDQELPVKRSEDELVRVEFPDGAAAGTLRLTWEIDALRAKGDRVSLVALVGVALLAGLSWRRDRSTGADAMVQRVGVGAAALVAVVLIARAHPIDQSVVGFGIRDGMLVTFDTRRAEVGAFDDAETTRLTHVLPAAWRPRGLLGSVPARSLATRDAAAAIALSPVGPNRLTVRGTLSGAGAAAPVRLVLRAAFDGRIVCGVDAVLGAPTALPDACVDGPPGDGPGVSRTLAFEANGELTVTGIDVDAGIVVVEAESMHNVLDDYGFEAFYNIGSPKLYPSNGVSMSARAGYEVDIALDRAVPLPAAAYDAWVLTRTAPRRLGNGFAQIRLEADGHTFSDAAPCSRSSLPFWLDDPEWEWLPSGRIDGAATRKIRMTFHKAERAFDGIADVDALAFVPAR
jgi:hypothetical protein